MTEAAEAAQRGVAMQTRLSMCAVSPETQGALQLQKLAVGAGGGPARPRVQAGRSGVCGAVGAQGLSSLSGSGRKDWVNGGHSEQAEFSSSM